MPHSDLSHEVVVVGGGIVGAALALALHRDGVDVALLERGARPPRWDAQDYDLRVYAISAASSQLLTGLGVWPDIAARRISPYQTMRVWDDEPASALRFDTSGQAQPQLGHIVENILIQDALWRHLDAVPQYLGARLNRLLLDDDAARLTLDDGREMTARLVVAADGAESQLRQWAGIECVRWRYPQQAVVCHVRSERPHDGAALQRFLPQGPLAFLPLADGRSSIVWSATHAAELLALDDASFCNRLAAAAQFQLGAIAACTRRVAYPLHLLHAHDYVQPRLALVGDAAHVVHPLAGQGVNMGLADAAALAEVIIHARHSGSDVGALRGLKRYERARKADNLEMLAVTDGLQRAFGYRAAGWDSLRGLGMSTVNRLTPLMRLLARRAAGS
ncbi:MAG: UbiH/UbiF/VisC/COQ6 family ubiquinone biosynthesis hydroxylase [Stenotrophobium sp.]